MKEGKISKNQLEHYLTISDGTNEVYEGIEELYDYLYNQQEDPYDGLKLRHDRTITIESNYPDLENSEKLFAKYNKIRVKYGLSPVSQIKIIEDEASMPPAPTFQWTKRKVAFTLTGIILYKIGESFVAFLGEMSTGIRAYNHGLEINSTLPKPYISNPDIATWGHPGANFLIGVGLKATAIFALFNLGVKSRNLALIVFSGIALFNLALTVGGTFIFGNIQQRAARYQGYIHNNDNETNPHTFWGNKFPSDIPEQAAIMGLTLTFGYMIAAGAYLTYRMCTHQERLFNGQAYTLINS